MNKYLLHGKLVSTDGKGDELSEILIEASKLLSTSPGCRMYVISRDKTDRNAVFVTEIWDTKEDHDNSLKDPAVKELIKRAMPIIDKSAKPEGQELEVIGGKGL